MNRKNYFHPEEIEEIEVSLKLNQLVACSYIHLRLNICKSSCYVLEMNVLREKFYFDTLEFSL